MIKYTKTTVFLLAMLFIVAACEEPEQEIFDGITPEELAQSTDPALIDVLKASAYQRIIGTWGGHNSLWSMHEVASDELVIAHKGADWEDGGQWIRTHRHEYVPTEEAVQNGWNYCYTAVGDVNLLIQQNPNVTALVAELKVLRGLVYLWLIDAYGNVPIIIETDTDPTPPTRSRADVFAFIESSILDNISELSTDNTKKTLNQWSARMILAKLYLNAEVYTGTARNADAEAQIDAIINSGVFSLEKEEFKEFRDLYKTMEDRMRPLVYELGFLMK